MASHKIFLYLILKVHVHQTLSFKQVKYALGTQRAFIGTNADVAILGLQSCVGCTNEYYMAIYMYGLGTGYISNYTFTMDCGSECIFIVLTNSVRFPELFNFFMIYIILN